MSETLTLKAEFGNSPVGSEVVETESYWDDYGCKISYEYEIVPAEAVAVHTEWAELPCVMEFKSALEEMDDPTLVVRFTISLGQAFTASTWMRFPRGLCLINEFLEGIKRLTPEEIS